MHERQCQQHAALLRCLVAALPRLYPLHSCAAGAPLTPPSF